VVMGGKPRSPKEKPLICPKCKSQDGIKSQERKGLIIN